MKKIIVWIVSSIIILFGIGFLFLQLINSTSFQLFGGIINQVDTDEKVVALTFDDGPTDKTTQILTILAENDVKATFFLTGKEIQENFTEAKQIVKAGHEVGNHTFSHERTVFKTPSFIKEEIEKTDQLIRDTGYEGEIHFRPPYGKKFLFLPYYLSEQDRHSILWYIEPESDPETGADSQKIIDHIGTNIESGSIILLHVMYDSRKESLESVDGMINELKAKGYQFKTVSELLQLEKNR